MQATAHGDVVDLRSRFVVLVPLIGRGILLGVTWSAIRLSSSGTATDSLVSESRYYDAQGGRPMKGQVTFQGLIVELSEDAKDDITCPFCRISLQKSINTKWKLGVFKKVSRVWFLKYAGLNFSSYGRFA